MSWGPLNWTFNSLHGDQPIPAFVVFLLTAGLIVFALLKGPRSKLIRLFILNTASISFWAFGIFQLTVASNDSQGLFWARLLNSIAVFIPSTFFHFTTVLTGKNGEHYNRRAIKLGYAVSFFLLCLSFTSLFIRGTIPRPGFYYYPSPGILFFLYLGFHVFYCGWALLHLMINARKAKGNERNSIYYVLGAYLLGFGGGSQTFLLSLGLPMWEYAMYLVPIAFIVIYYAVIAKHLLDIRIIIRKTLLYTFVSAVLAATYAGLVTLLAYLVGTGDRGVYIASLGAHGSVVQWLAAELQAYFAEACIATAILSVALGVFVLAKGPQTLVKRMWCAMCISVAIWSLSLGMVVYAPSFSAAYYWQMFLYFGAIWIPVVFLHFVGLVTSYSLKRSLAIAYFVAFVEHILNLTGHLATVAPKAPFAFYTVTFPAYWSYVVYFFALVLSAHFLLLKKGLASEGRVQQQVKYIAVGTLTGFAGGATTFLLAFGVPVFPYGIYTVPVYVMTVSYAIYRHQLLDISVVIRKTLLYALVTTSLAAVYVGTITLVAHFLGERHGSVSAFSSAMAAIFITLLFNPVRIRIQRFIDRHFVRESMDQAMLREATSGFVHEIKRPLAKISLPAELSIQDLEDVSAGRRSSKDVLPKVLQRLRYILDQTSDAGAKIEAIREFTTSDGKVSNNLRLCEIIRKGVKAEQALLKRHRVELKLNLADNLPPLQGHAKQLEIVFSNLIKNAAQALATLKADAKRSLWIDASVSESFLLVRIKDSGPGIKLESQRQIFEPYFTTKGAHGTGLGLYLSQQIVQTHGGTIEVSSQPGHGAEFIVRLPMTS